MSGFPLLHAKNEPGNSWLGVWLSSNCWPIETLKADWWKLQCERLLSGRTLERALLEWGHPDPEEESLKVTIESVQNVKKQSKQKVLQAKACRTESKQLIDIDRTFNEERSRAGHHMSV